MKLNLEAKTVPEQRIKSYLEKSASAMLADKILHGVFIEKDGKKLLNRKTLGGFMRYATEEARKLAEKGASSACVEDEVVYGWAIHYFEEDSIEETLYNEDGTEYKKSVPVPKKTTPIAPPKPKPQMSLFEMISEQKTEKPVSVSVHKEEKPQISVPTPTLEKAQGSPLYQRYISVKKEYPEQLVLMRLGDFYEVFGEEAKKIANLLDLTLTGRDCGLTERVPMVGFPYHATDKYFRELLENGYSLAIMETDKDVRLLNAHEDDIVDDDLTEEEMQEFDVVNEKQWITTNTYADSDGIVHEQEDDLTFTRAFDKDALAILSDIFGDFITLE